MIPIEYENIKTIILNSGEGKRMGHLTDNKPKCMVELNGDTILSRQLKILEEHGLSDIIITTGPHNENLIDYSENISKNLNIDFVHNPIYDTTNYIYSLYLAKGLIKTEDVLLIHGDLFFDKEILERILKGKEYSKALINVDEKSPTKDFKAVVEDGFVKEIGVYLKDEVLFQPFYYLKNRDFKRWMESIEEFVAKGKTGVYAENALNHLLLNGNVKLKGLKFSDEFCIEIDNEKDLKKAKKYLEGYFNG